MFDIEKALQSRNDDMGDCERHYRQGFADGVEHAQQRLDSGDNCIRGLSRAQYIAAMNFLKRMNQH